MKTFFATENGSTISILGFPGLGLTQQLLGCLCRMVKTPSGTGNGIKFHYTRGGPALLNALQRTKSCHVHLGMSH